MDLIDWLAWATIAAIAFGMAAMIWKLCRELERTQSDLEMEREVSGRTVDALRHEVRTLEDELIRARAVSFKFELELHKTKNAVSRVGWAKSWN